MTRSQSPLLNLVDKVRGFGRAADAVARAAENTAQARAAGDCLVCGENPSLPGVDYCEECRVDAVKAGAGVAKSAIDKFTDALIGRR